MIGHLHCDSNPSGRQACLGLTPELKVYSANDSAPQFRPVSLTRHTSKALGPRLPPTSIPAIGDLRFCDPTLKRFSSSRRFSPLHSSPSLAALQSCAVFSRTSHHGSPRYVRYLHLYPEFQSPFLLQLSPSAPAHFCPQDRADNLLRADHFPETKGSLDNGESQSDSQTDFDLPPLTTTTERKLMAKVDWHIVPCLCILYLLAFLDR